MKKHYLLMFTGLALLAGCATGPTPQNAQEYREAVKKGAYGAFSEVYEVNGAYAKVAARLKGKSSECLNRVITIEQCRGASCTSRDYIFTPNSKGNASKTEITVQMKVNPDNGIYLGGKPPEGGMFVAVTDVTPVGSGKTRVAVYGTNVSMFAHIPKAMKHWAQGTNLGCPDLTADV